MKLLRNAVGPVVGLVVGIVVGALGSVAHWGHRPWGLVAALALVLASATMLRAWAGRRALVAQALGLGAVLVVLSRPGPSGDVLIELTTSSSLPGADPGVFGRIWLAGSLVAVALVAVAPAGLFADRQAPVHGEEPEDELGVTPGEEVGGGLSASPWSGGTGSVGEADR